MRGAEPNEIVERPPVRFLLTGAGAALLFLSLSLLFATAGLTPFVGSVAAYSIALVVGYSAQRNWTFGARHRHTRAFPRYMALQGGCALSSGTIAHGATHILGLAPLPMSILTMCAVGFLSYVASSRWVFPNVAPDAE